MSKISIGLNPKQREGVAELLRGTLADLYVLYTKTRNYHWNVEGPLFHDLHKFFESQYEELDGSIDEVAERLRALGHYAPGSLAEFLKEARLKEDGGGSVAAEAMVVNLLGDHEAVIRGLREDVQKTADIGDAGTSDFLTGLMEGHEKMAWMLRAMSK